MKNKLNNQILYAESVDDRHNMYNSTRAKQVLNIMLGVYFTTWAFSLIYLVSPKVSADFSQKLSMVLLYIGLASALRNSASLGATVENWFLSGFCLQLLVMFRIV